MSETAMLLDMDADLENRVLALASAQQRESRWLIQDAVREYVEREERREAHWDEAMQSWHGYRQDGLHITQEEMECWFDQIEAGQTASLPCACHK